MKKLCCSFVVVFCLLIVCGSVSAFDSFITMQDGYFYDASAGKAWVPHGIAYQTWNRPLGVWQTHEQIEYDLDEMVKMGANSVRIDIVWQHAEEDGDNQWKWDNYDYFVQVCEDRGLRIFALIGYQWPPNWFEDAWYTMHPPEWDAEGIYHPERWQSDIINYEHPEARAQYAEWISTVCDRYKDNKAIVGWIVGNEYGYLGLWSGLLDGYDPETEQAFRDWCADKYATIADVNAKWGTSFASFDDIVFVEQYRAYGSEGAEWADMVQFREDSIAEFTALSAESAKNADPNHLISYSTVGMQWGEEDWRYHAEDRGKITTAAAALGADIDFFSVNNYPWSVLGHESQNGHWGISFTKKVAGVPVLYTETGFTSSETMWPGMDEHRQGPLIRNALWESLEAGAIGTHVFSWMDRPWITDREKGFGIVYADRRIKPAFWTTRNAYNLMEQVEIHDLLGGSEDPEPDIAFLWTDANDSQHNRYECEMQQIAGALERLGYAPYFIDLQELADGVYTNYKLIILPRNMRVEEEVGTSGKTILDFLRTEVIPAGVHVMATADLPGLQDMHGNQRAAFETEVNALFGIDASDIGGFEAPMRRREYVSWYWEMIEVDFNANSSINGYHCWPQVWKYSDEIEITDGTLWATMDTGRNKGYEDSDTEVTKWDGIWGDVHVRSGWGWAYDGNNMVQIWGDSGMWNDFPVVPFGRYVASAYLRSNTGDPLCNGEEAYVAIEWYDQEENLLSTSESAHLTTHTGDAWVQYKVDATAPAEAYAGRRIIKVAGTGDGSLYVDNKAVNPAMVVKDHGAAKAAIFLFSAGDQKPDGDLDGDPDTYAWQWRYDYFGAVVKDYFGVQPQVEVTGTNAFLCLAEYRTCADGSTLWQVKNYMYDTAQPSGGDPLTFTITSDLFAGKTVEAFEQARIIEENSDGTIQITLDPDGMEMLYVYDTEKLPVANWRLDEASWSGVSGEVKDTSENSNDGTAYGGASTDPEAQAGRSGLFDGTDDYVEAPNSSDLQVSGDMTLSFWIKPENAGSNRINPLDKSYGGEFALTMETSCSLSYYHGTARAGGKYWAWTALPSGSITNGSWQHIVIVRDTVTKQMRSYLNGVPMRTATYSSDPNRLPSSSTYPVRIAKGYTSRCYQGRIDEVKIFDRVLGENDIAREYTRRSAPVGHWGLDEGSWDGTSGEVKDRSGKGNDGTSYNDAGTGREAMVGRSGLFDGVNDYVEIPNSSDLQVSGDMTLSFWIKPANAGSNRINPLDKSYGGEFALTMETSGQLSYYHGTARAGGKYWGWAALTSGTLENDEWQHIALVRNTATKQMKSYLNGVPMRTATYSSDPNKLPSPSTYPVRIANGYTSKCFEGLIDEVKIFGEVLSDDEVAAEVSRRGRIVPRQKVHIIDAPAVVHPFGDKVFEVHVGYDCLDRTDLTLKLAYKEAGDNGDGTPNEIYEQLEEMVTGSGDQTFWIWIPDADQNDSDYISTPDGGNYEFLAWLEDGSSEVIAQALPQATQLKWGVRPTAPLPTMLNKGDQVSIPIEWEELYEYLPWEVTPLARNDSFPSRVALFRSSKTEAQYPGQYDKVDQVVEWIESMGYESGNPLDVAFDNVVVEGLFSDDFNDGNMSGWTREAGCANWGVEPFTPTEPKQGTQEDTFSAVGLSGAGVVATDGRYLYVKRWATYPGPSAFNKIGTGYQGTTAGQNYGAFAVNAVNSLTATCCSDGYIYNPISSNPYQVEKWDPVTGERTYVDVPSGLLRRDTGVVQSGYQMITSDGRYVYNLAYAYGGTYNAWKVKVFDPFDGWSVVREFTTSATTYYTDGLLADGEYIYPIEWKASNSARITRIDAVTGAILDVWTINQGDTDVISGQYDWINGKVWLGGLRNPNIYRYTGSEGGTLRASRIGNSDNIQVAGESSWSDYTASVDLRYNAQGPYLNDAELYVRYQDRDNFVKVGIRNFYGFWRIKYTVRSETNIVDQGWLHEFPKNDRPEENTWYNLKVQAAGDVYTVFFDNEEVGVFTNALFATGKIGVGSMAVQLGIWEPRKGYFFIDDDEYSFWAPEGQSQLVGHPLDLDWGYLDAFFPTLILPSTYVMSDIEVSNVTNWLARGLRCIIATDGSIAMKNETGAYDLGRIEDLFGVAAAVDSMSGLNKVVVGDDGHYVTLDYEADDQITASGDAKPWNTLTTGTALGTVDNGTESAPALIVNTCGSDVTNSPKKVLCFNFGADTGDQLAGNFSQIAQRAFEWTQGEAHKVRLELKYTVPMGDPSLDLCLLSIDGWILTGTGTDTLIMDIPDDGIMTGDNLYWVMYVYTWDAEDPWLEHGGFYSSANDSGGGVMVSLDGKGLQILGITDIAYAGRDWDLWVAYNTRGEDETITYGIKDKGSLTDEDNFEDGDYNGWTIIANANISWSVVNGKLRATTVGSAGYAYIERDGLDVSDQNITVEYDTYFDGSARWGGFRYRGIYLDVNPSRIGWRDDSASYYYPGLTQGEWHHVVVTVRDGDPYMLSDLYVDGVPLFVAEPIHRTSWPNTRVGLVSPYYDDYVEWDNVRVVDEEYSDVSELVNGERVPTNENDVSFWPSLPDYDPDMWEHEGTTLGGEYEWYIYFRGEDVHSRFDGGVYFAPRLMVEDANFPTNMNPGDTVDVPIEWEALGSNVPAKLRVKLENPYTGLTHVDKTFMVTSTDGSADFTVTVPSNTPAGPDYLWAVFLYPTNAADPYLERIGLDDTFRFDKEGQPIEPEMVIEVSSTVGDDFTVFSDAGIPASSDIYTWAGGSATFDAHFTVYPPPEGVESFYTLSIIEYAGWGIFSTSGNRDMSEYTGGYLKFWLWSFETLKVELEGPPGTKSSLNMGSTGGNWQEISIPLSDFGSVDLSQIYGFFMITSYDGAEYMVDHIRYSMTP